MKKELRDSRFRKIIDGIRTRRKQILNNQDDSTTRKLKKLKKTLDRLSKDWILDGFSKELIREFILVLEEDISS